MDPKIPETVTVVDGYTLANPFERILAFIIDIVVYGIFHAILAPIFALFGMPWLGILLALSYLF